MSDAVFKGRTFHKLTVNGNNYSINQRLDFDSAFELKQSTITKVLNFAYSMTFGRLGEHRNHRTGGSHHRRRGEIFANTFQGKLAECAVANFFHIAEIAEDLVPDFSVSPLGEWDNNDYNISGKHISIKSTKSYGQLLLLESRDYDENGVYLPDLTVGKTTTEDIILLVRVSPFCEEEMRKQKLLYSDDIPLDTLRELLLPIKWKCDFAGFLTGDDLRFIIKKGFVIPQGAVLNGSTKMDADNYYVQIKDLHPITELKEHLNG